MGAARVSVVIPTYNGIATLPALLDALDRQRSGSLLEVIAIDSGSTDGTRSLVRRRADTVLDVPSHEFNHGLTRNVGISQARGDFVVLLVQDALPANDTWLDALVAPFDTDDRIAGTYGRQVPRSDASSITRYYLGLWAAAGAAPRVSTGISRDVFDRLSPAAKFELCIFDDVCSCVRRTVWQQHPFRPTPIAEDMIWAKEVLLAGHKVAYVPGATVVHSHERSALYEYRRTRALHQVLHDEFRLHTIPTLPHLARAIGSSLRLHARCERADGAIIPSARGIALAFAWPLGQFVGARDSTRGRPPRRATGV